MIKRLVVATCTICLTCSTSSDAEIKLSKTDCSQLSTTMDLASTAGRSYLEKISALKLQLIRPVFSGEDIVEFERVVAYQGAFVRVGKEFFEALDKLSGSMKACSTK